MAAKTTTTTKPEPRDKSQRKRALYRALDDGETVTVAVMQVMGARLLPMWDSGTMSPSAWHAAYAVELEAVLDALGELVELRACNRV